MEQATFELTPNGNFIRDHSTSSWIAVRAIASIALYQVGLREEFGVNDRHCVDLGYFPTNTCMSTSRGFFPSHEAAKAFVYKLTGETML